MAFPIHPTLVVKDPPGTGVTDCPAEFSARREGIKMYRIANIAIFGAMPYG